MVDDIRDIERRIIGIKFNATDMKNNYRHGPYGKTHFKEVSLLADMMLIQLEYVKNDLSKGGHDGEDTG